MRWERHMMAQQSAINTAAINVWVLRRGGSWVASEGKKEQGLD